MTTVSPGPKIASAAEILKVTDTAYRLSLACRTHPQCASRDSPGGREAVTTLGGEARHHSERDCAGVEAHGDRCVWLLYPPSP